MSETANSVGGMMPRDLAESVIARRAEGESSAIFPTSVLETCEAERLIETAVVIDGEIGTEHDADAAADLAHAPRGDVWPGVIEKPQTAVVLSRGEVRREQKNECREQRSNVRSLAS